MKRKKASLERRQPTRPNVIGLEHLTKTVSNWFDTSTFAAPAMGFYGHAGTGVLQAPGLVNFDAALPKAFRLHERQTLEFRAEFYSFWRGKHIGVSRQ